MVENNGEYGDMPDAKTLMPAGHSRIDCAVRMVMKGKGYVDLLSSYGTCGSHPLRWICSGFVLPKGSVVNSRKRR